MSDMSSPESATASFTAVSACIASGVSAVRDTFENPTPLTAILHRFSHMSFLRDSDCELVNGQFPRSAIALGESHRARSSMPYPRMPRVLAHAEPSGLERGGSCREPLKS